MARETTVERRVGTEDWEEGGGGMGTGWGGGRGGGVGVWLGSGVGGECDERSEVCHDVAEGDDVEEALGGDEEDLLLRVAAVHGHGGVVVAVGEQGEPEQERRGMEQGEAEGQGQAQPQEGEVEVLAVDPLHRADREGQGEPPVSRHADGGRVAGGGWVRRVGACEGEGGAAAVAGDGARVDGGGAGVGVGAVVRE